MKKILFILLGFCISLAACMRKTNVPAEMALEMAGIEATAPYFSKDNKGNAVLCWTEKDGKDSLYRLKYSVYNTQTNRFNAAITVPASAGCSNSAESMGKVAFKADGTVYAIFARRFPKEKNPYAGAIYYSFSQDGGKRWSDAHFLHTDTAHSYGRSFFDIAALKDGEIGAVWLDGRFGKSIKGSALFFARTEKGKGFETEACLDKGTCECCRTDILSDSMGNIHVAYRSIAFPPALSDKQVRDMAYKLSIDNGKTFSAPKTISKDNWEIDGCPHSGPSLAATQNGVHALWFTAGGSPGLYYTGSDGIGGDFRNRMLVSASGRHPQMIALKDGNLAMVYEEPINGQSEEPMQHKHSHGEMKMTHTPAGSAKIVLNILKNGGFDKSIDVTNGMLPDNHAVLTSVNNGLLIAWVREEEHLGPKLYYTFLSN